MSSKLEVLRSRVTKMSHDKKETLSMALRTVEMAGTAFAIGMVTGKNADAANPYGKPPQIFGASLELGVGLVSHIAAFWAPKQWASHLHNVGDGALAAWTYQEGLAAGVAWHNKK